MLKYVAEEIASITMRVTGYPIIITDKKSCHYRSRQR